MDLLTGTLTACAVMAGIVLLVCFGTIFGAAAGFIVGFFFEGPIINTLRGFGIAPTFAMWELGATLGFVSGFFRSRTQTGDTSK